MIPARDIHSSPKEKAVQGAKRSPEDEKKWKAAVEFESMFINEMMKSMRKNLPDTDLTEKSQGREIFQEMLDREYSDIAGKKDEMGLASMLYKHMTGNEKLPPKNDAIPGFNKNFAPSFNALKAYGEPQGNKTSLTDLIEEISAEFKVDSALVKSVIQQESSGRSDAVSPVGAKGLMQLMDSTAAEMGVKNVFDPRQNITGGVKYLKKLLDQFNGDEKLALAAYNAGPGNVSKYGGVPPFAETQNYVRKVIANKNTVQGGNL